MVRSVRAIYENGVFRPLELFDGLPERSAVNLRVEEIDGSHGTLADFAGRWTAQDADCIAAIIEAEFERINPNDW
jgi:predicted DNA-binding antitoxin AbrB/MazE fold protein